MFADRSNPVLAPARPLFRRLATARGVLAGSACLGPAEDEWPWRQARAQPGIALGPCGRAEAGACNSREARAERPEDRGIAAGSC
jgi:hypothetical protein